MLHFTFFILPFFILHCHFLRCSFPRVLTFVTGHVTGSAGTIAQMPPLAGRIKANHKDSVFQFRQNLSHQALLTG